MSPHPSILSPLPCYFGRTFQKFFGQLFRKGEQLLFYLFFAIVALGFYLKKFAFCEVSVITKIGGKDRVYRTNNCRLPAEGGYKTDTLQVFQYILWRGIKGKRGGMENRSQGTFEFMLMMGLILLTVGLIVTFIALTAQGLGSNVSGEIENVRDNVVIPGLVGAAPGIVLQCR